MKHYVLTIILGLYSVAAHAQQQVVASSGNAVQNTSGSISWTLGEPVVATLTLNNKVLNQGFQQGSTKKVPQSVILNSDFNISACPNPTHDRVLLSVEKPEQLLCQIFDLHGKLVQSKSLVDKTTSIDFSNLASGSYLMKVLQGKKELKTVTIIKQ